MALKLAVNREELVEKITFGAATIGNDFHHSPAMPYWPADIEQRQYDPDKAKSLLASVGMEGLTVSFSTADSITTGAVDAAILMAEHAKAAGITINVVQAAKAELNDTLRAEMYRDMAVLARDEGGTLIPYYPNFVYARRSNVTRGESLSPAWQMDGYRYASRWSFA